MWLKRTVICCLLLMAVGAPADSQKAAEKLRKAGHELQIGNLPKAEKLLREAVQEDPNSLRARLLFADLLAGTNRYAASAEEYTTILKLDESQKKLTEDQRRHVINGQGVGFALGGNLAKAKEIYEHAIKADPDYAMYWYNLACVYAEQGELEPALEKLQDAWKRRKNVLEGEPFPDPRKDSSFARYLNDKRFQEAVRDMVF